MKPMDQVSVRRGLLATLLGALVLQFLLAPAPLGLDTRSLSSYALWFYVMGILLAPLLLITNLAGLVLAWKRPKLVRYSVIILFLGNLIFTASDLSGLGGPYPGVEIIVVEVLFTAVTLLALWLGLVIRARTGAPQTPQANP